MSVTTSSFRSTTRRSNVPAHLTGASNDGRERTADDRERPPMVIALEPHWAEAIDCATD